SRVTSEQARIHLDAAASAGLKPDNFRSGDPEEWRRFVPAELAAWLWQRTTPGGRELMAVRAIAPSSQVRVRGTNACSGRFNPQACQATGRTPSPHLGRGSRHVARQPRTSISPERALVFCRLAVQVTGPERRAQKDRIAPSELPVAP